MTVVNLQSFSKKVKIQKRLVTLSETIDEVYGELDSCYEMLNEMEEQAVRVEEAYNKVLLEYIEEVGVENVEIEYLEYTTLPLAMTWDGKKITYTIFTDENQ